VEQPPISPLKSRAIATLAATRTATTIVRARSPPSTSSRATCSNGSKLDGKTLIAGLSWQEPETFNAVPTEGVAANVLCEAHNGRLSELDSLLGKFADDVQQTDKGEFAPGKLFRASGSGIERWMLKCLLGMSASKNISARLKLECLDLLFERMRWPDGWGFYFDTHRTTIHHTNGIEIQTL